MEAHSFATQVHIVELPVHVETEEVDDSRTALSGYTRTVHKRHDEVALGDDVLYLGAQSGNVP